MDNICGNGCKPENLIVRLNEYEAGYACRECEEIWTHYLEETAQEVREIA